MSERRGLTVAPSPAGRRLGQGLSKFLFGALGAAAVVALAATLTAGARAADGTSGDTSGNPSAAARRAAEGEDYDTRGYPRFKMPRVTLEQFTSQSRDSVDAWVRRNRGAERSRDGLFEAIRSLLAQQNRFELRVAEVYPKNQFEWLMITDTAADTLVARVSPILRGYRRLNPEELLGPGRQALEARMAQIVGPPSALMGFHFLRLSNFIYAAADSLAGGPSTDVAGLRDGALRFMMDWAHLWDEAHADPIQVYGTRISQQDWIVARLEDRCGNSGRDTWNIKEQYMAVELDTTVVPIEQHFFHELILEAAKCPDDVRDILVSLPMFRDFENEVARRQKEGTLDLQDLPMFQPR